jgi:serine/threonine protein kinase
MSSVYMDNQGNMHKINNKINGKSFFRKYSEPGGIELDIAQRIKSSPHPNIVKIYKIGPDYFDMEKVDISINLDDLRNSRTELKSAKNHLHSLKVVYLDWKRDNMGFGTDGKVKIFDFNMSGTFSKSRSCFITKNGWNRKAISGYRLRNAVNIGKCKTPIESDNWIFAKLFS